MRRDRTHAAKRTHTSSRDRPASTAFVHQDCRFVAEKSAFPAANGPNLTIADGCMVGLICGPPPGRARPQALRNKMDDEPKTAAELKEIRLNRKLAQDAEGVKAMADIGAADIAIRQRTANLRAMRLAKEAADRDKPPEPKAKPKKK